MSVNHRVFIQLTQINQSRTDLQHGRESYFGISETAFLTVVRIAFVK